MKAAVESFIIADRRWNTSHASTANSPQPMDVDALFGQKGGGKGKSKNAKGKGKD